ncbi:MAG: PilZ domain-containing protein [Oligoflexia bacterium]|nr:PilZ domain-containing protein [Oligoflexia bacterium]
MSLTLLRKMLKLGGEAAKPLPPRPPRVRLGELHSVSFKAREPAGVAEGGELRIANLSAEGIGFVKDLRAWPEPGATISGTLRIGEFFQEVKAEVRHQGGNLVGCRFVETGPGFRERILQSFLTELAALRMVRVNPDVLQRPEDGFPSLYVGENGCELYVIESAEGSGELVRFTLSFFGNQIEGTGEGELWGGELRSGRISPELLLTAQRLLSNIDGLDSRLAASLGSLLTPSEG